jgi:hypothetical protein
MLTTGWCKSGSCLRATVASDYVALSRQHEFIFSVFTAKGGAVAGGSGIPARGGNIFVADWR